MSCERLCFPAVVIAPAPAWLDTARLQQREVVASACHSPGGENNRLGVASSRASLCAHVIAAPPSSPSGRQPLSTISDAESHSAHDASDLKTVISSRRPTGHRM